MKFLKEIKNYLRMIKETVDATEFTVKNRNYSSQLDSIHDRIISLQRTVEREKNDKEKLYVTLKALSNALCDKYEHGLFIFSEDGKIPMVIRNGKELTNDMTTSFNIDWCPGEIPEIHIDQCAATRHDIED